MFLSNSVDMMKNLHRWCMMLNTFFCQLPGTISLASFHDILHSRENLLFLGECMYVISRPVRLCKFSADSSCILPFSYNWFLSGKGTPLTCSECSSLSWRGFSSNIFLRCWLVVRLFSIRRHLSLFISQLNFSKKSAPNKGFFYVWQPEPKRICSVAA